MDFPSYVHIFSYLQLKIYLTYKHNCLKYKFPIGEKLTISQMINSLRSRIKTQRDLLLLSLLMGKENVVKLCKGN